jgi:hypothetical protein
MSSTGAQKGVQTTLKTIYTMRVRAPPGLEKTLITELKNMDA